MCASPPNSKRILNHGLSFPSNPIGTHKRDGRNIISQILQPTAPTIMVMAPPNRFASESLDHAMKVAAAATIYRDIYDDGVVEILPALYSGNHHLFSSLPHNVRASGVQSYLAPLAHILSHKHAPAHVHDGARRMVVSSAFFMAL